MIKLFEVVETETNGLGDYDFTILFEMDNSEEDIVVVGSYLTDENDLGFMIEYDEQFTDDRQETLEKFFKTDRKDIIEAILR